MKNEIIEKLIGITKEYIEGEIGELNENTNLHTELGLTSLELVSMIGDIEDAFDVELPDSEIAKLTTIGDIVSFIEANRA